ncbi:MAG TPA: BON domain-containing protein [Candidatus Deferrimicrobium sp.]|nr:BON domain-containing protein [Candidatus Deferrimicrobium sp.]
MKIGHSKTDQEIEKQVTGAIYQELKDSARNINVSARNGRVTILGMVDVLAEKVAVERVARQIFGVHEVDNAVNMAMDNFLPDKDLNELVEQRLAGSPDKEISKLGAQTHGGVVYLQGHTESVGAVREAEKIIATVRGVKEIISEVKVSEYYQPDDATITNAVERAFSLSGIVDSRKVTTSTNRGVVTLQGMLDTIVEIEAAAEIAYRVPGVKAVTSEIRARHGVDEGDRALTNQLRNLLSTQINMSRGTLLAYVVDGTAFLTGEVFNVDDKLRAEELTRELQGLSGISNSIQVSGHQLS